MEKSPANNIDDILSEKIPLEMFEFVPLNENLVENIEMAKHRGYFRDAFSRFVKDKNSVVCGAIIFILILYAVFAPFFSNYKISDKDSYYSFASPKNNLFNGTSFWDGSYKTTVNEQTFEYYKNIPGAITKIYEEKTASTALTAKTAKNSRARKWHTVRLDSYAKVGWVKMLLTQGEWESAKKWEEQNGSHLFFPIIDQSQVANPTYYDDQNAWFLTDERGVAVLDETGTVIPIFLLADKDSLGAGDDGLAYTVSRMNGQQLETRVLYSEWYRYTHDGKYASFLFGADAAGYDIFTRLAFGARLSLVLSICVASVNLLLGIIIGALEGYYGGTFDLVMERVKDILYDVPFVVCMTLFQIYLAQKAGPIVSMFFAFVFFGWIGTSSTVRAQFYRFKGHEYVMAARTLGASDARLIFRHILPNAIGFIITASVLSIPGVIFSEANLTYLGIVNLQTDTMTSIGTMLNNGQMTLAEHPHAVFFPATFISLLLVCFNGFGNGLRDAFNPQLRGVSE